ncbi:hypothetical protein D3C73_1444820 [compost metagenome]
MKLTGEVCLPVQQGFKHKLDSFTLVPAGFQVPGNSAQHAVRVHELISFAGYTVLILDQKRPLLQQLLS